MNGNDMLFAIMSRSCHRTFWRAKPVYANRSNMNEFHVLLSFCVPKSKLWSVNGDHCRSGVLV